MHCVIVSIGHIYRLKVLGVFIDLYYVIIYNAAKNDSRKIKDLFRV